MPHKTAAILDFAPSKIVVDLFALQFNSGVYNNTYDFLLPAMVASHL